MWLPPVRIFREGLEEEDADADISEVLCSCQKLAFRFLVLFWRVLDGLLFLVWRVSTAFLFGLPWRVSTDFGWWLLFAFAFCCVKLEV